LEVEGPGTGPDRIEALLGGVTVGSQSLEALAAGADGVDLELVVLAQRLEDGFEAVALGVDDGLEALEGDALGFEAGAAGGGVGPLLGVSLQAALHLGVAVGQHPAALGDAGDADLELLL